MKNLQALYKQKFTTLLEIILFGIDINNPPNEDEHSLGYLIFKWYQSVDLYHTLQNPKFKNEKTFGNKYWWVHFIQSNIPALEKYIIRVGKGIYEIVKPMFKDWADSHDAENFEKMMNIRADYIEDIYLVHQSLPEYAEHTFAEDWDFLLGIIKIKDFYPFDILPNAGNIINIIIKKFKDFLKKTDFTDILKNLIENEKDEIQYNKDILEEVENEKDKEYYQEEIQNHQDNIKEFEQYLKKGIDHINHVELVNLIDDLEEEWGVEKSDIFDPYENHHAITDWIWLDNLIWLIQYFNHKGNELPQWIEKVREIRKLINTPFPSSLNDVMILIEKLIHFTHNNGDLIRDHAELYGEGKIFPSEREEIYKVTGEYLEDLYNILDYFATVKNFPQKDLEDFLKEFTDYTKVEEKIRVAKNKK